MNQRNIMLFLFATLFIVNCAASTKNQKDYENNKKSPIALNGSKEIVFENLNFNINPFAKLGQHHDGIFKLPALPEYTWDRGFLALGIQFDSIASQELTSLGYTVTVPDTMSKSNKEIIKIAQVQFKLSGVVNYLTYDTYAPLAGNFTEASLYIIWTLCDVKSDSTFTFTTNGYGNSDGVINKSTITTYKKSEANHNLASNVLSGNIVIATGFKTALEQLLADEAFSRLLRKQ